MLNKLILIRHGETDWNRNRKYCGFSDIALNEKGRKEAKALSMELENEKIDMLYASGLTRTMQTAEIAFPGKDIKKISGLREMNFGVFEGRSYEEIMQDSPEIYRNWMTDPLDFTIPDGESLNGFAQRVRESLNEILMENKNKTAAIFTHAGPIRIILCDKKGIGLDQMWDIEVKTGEIYIL